MSEQFTKLPYEMVDGEPQVTLTSRSKSLRVNTKPTPLTFVNGICTLVGQREIKAFENSYNRMPSHVKAMFHVVNRDAARRMVQQDMENRKQLAVSGTMTSGHANMAAAAAKLAERDAEMSRAGVDEEARKQLNTEIMTTQKAVGEELAKNATSGLAALTAKK